MQHTDEMSDADLDVIERFAAGDEGIREDAIAAHRRGIGLVGARGNAHQRFMAEIDNPSPDRMMRARYRDEVMKLQAERHPAPKH